MLEAIAALSLLLFTVLMTIGASATLERVIRYRRHKIKPPVLLKRDILVIGGLAVDFVLILIVRAFGFGPYLAGNPLWVIGTSAVGVGSAAVYVYYELFVIEKRR